MQQAILTQRLTLFGRGLAFLALLLSNFVAQAATTVVWDRNGVDEATPEFHFRRVPAPCRNDAASDARFVLLIGERDPNGADLQALHDGKVPQDQDKPGQNFFFKAGTVGGRILVDLGRVLGLKQVNTYSWHPGARGPQLYRLYASDGMAPGFDSEPKGTLSTNLGWHLLAAVDTRPEGEELGGQYGVSIHDPESDLGRYRFLLFDVAQTETNDPFGNTFFSEIDIVDANATAAPDPVQPLTPRIVKNFEVGEYRITIDTTEATDLTDWAAKILGPMAQEWYPKVVELLPSKGFTAPKHISITFKPGDPGIPAATGGSRITCNAQWFRENLDGEAKGSVVHEMVHVVQHYGSRGRSNVGYVRPPGWLVEGIPDFIRWFKFEPEAHGAEITKHNLARARYNASYRITANFLNWVSENYDHELVPDLNAALREGTYHEAVWRERTGHALPELGDSWHSAVTKKVESEEPR